MDPGLGPVIATLLMVQAGEVAFAPPVDRPLIVETTETRTDARGTKRFGSVRRVTFTRDGTGWLATVVMERADAPPGEPAALTERMMAGLIGYPLRFRIDAAGRVTGSDHPGAWARMMDGVERATAGAQPAATIAAQMRALPPAQQDAALASFIAPLLPPATPVAPGNRRAITGSARAIDGSAVALTGEETVEVAGAVTEEQRRLSGNSGAAGVERTEQRRRSRTTGLTLSRRETLVLTLGDRRQTIVRTMALIDKVS